MTPPSFASSAARVALLCTAAFVGILALLHVVRADVDPSWHFISEYEIGRHGWLMQGAFLVLAAANLALLAAVRPVLHGVAGTLGAVLFLVGTLGTILGGVFVSDSVGTLPEAASPSGRMHALGGTLGLAGVLGTWLLSAALLRDPAWRPARRAVVVATTLFTLGFLVSFVAIATLVGRSGGTFGPDVPVGWPNRIGILAGCAWLAIVARQAGRIAASTESVA